MAEKLQGDLARTVSRETDQTWPVSVKLQLQWRDEDGRPIFRNMIIDADAFYGRGGYGAPMDGAALIAAIERMRRDGPPDVLRRSLPVGKKSGNKKR